MQQRMNGFDPHASLHLCLFALRVNSQYCFEQCCYLFYSLANKERVQQKHARKVFLPLYFPTIVRRRCEFVSKSLFPLPYLLPGTFPASSPSLSSDALCSAAASPISPPLLTAGDDNEHCDNNNNLFKSNPFRRA